VCFGGGRLIGSSSAGTARSISPSRVQLCRAATNPRQWAMASSIGASAREDRIDAAIMTPGVASPEITSQAPTASTVDCRSRRRTLDRLPKPPIASDALRWEVR
jgi:hypothetical protein